MELKAVPDNDVNYFLAQIALISKEAMIEQSSKGGNKARDNARREFEKQTTDWTQYYEGDKRKIVKETNSLAQKLGIRVSHKNKGSLANPPSMKNFITSFTMETTGTTVVGGTHKAFYPKIIRDGKVVGRRGRVGGVSGDTIAILEKLNSGRVSTDPAKKLKWMGKEKSIENFKNKWVKNRDFMGKGWRKSLPYIQESMTTAWASLISKKANNIKPRKMKDVG